MTDPKADSALAQLPEQTLRQATTVAEVSARSPLSAIDTRVLLCHALGWRRTALITRSDQTLETAQIDACLALIARRFVGEPVAQLVGTREFFGRDFIVTPAVLIPRPDTELLVELALQVIDAHAASRTSFSENRVPANVLPQLPTPRMARISVLDLGTGSGAIAVTLAAERPMIAVVGTDRSADALQVARRNGAAILGEKHTSAASDSGPLPLPLAEQRIGFAQGDWFSALQPSASGIAKNQTHEPANQAHRFDVIVSNPPYIAAHDPHLLSGDLRFEPAGALSDGGDGLSDLRHIADGAGAWLQPGGHLLMEHGYDQGLAVRQILAAANFTAIETMRDLAGHERVTLGVWPS